VADLRYEFRGFSFSSSSSFALFLLPLLHSSLKIVGVLQEAPLGGVALWIHPCWLLNVLARYGRNLTHLAKLAAFFTVVVPP